MEPKKTHREVKQPQISARALADFMAASETTKRRIVHSCRYQPRARVIQHDEAKMILSKFIREGNRDLGRLREDAARIRDRMADSDFDRDVNDHNADYIARFADIFGKLDLPDADIVAPGRTPPIILNGVRVTIEIHFRLRRLTRTNKLRIGAGMLRYAKGRNLARDVAEWQSAFLMGYLERMDVEEGAEPEHKLCVTVDAHSGASYGAPGDSARRFLNMEAACATIAERWNNIPKPPGAVL